MTIAKIYEVEGFRFGFTPKGDPLKGILVSRFPELEPYTAEVNLTKPGSCEGYARRAAELHGMSRKGLERALTILCSRRFEEVEAAAEAEGGPTAEEPEELPEVGEEEIDALVGRSGVLGRFVTDAAEIHGVVGEKAPLKLLTLGGFGAQLAPLPNGKPIGANVVLIATWGRGKNHLCDAVADLLPEDFYLAFESASAKALYYRAEKDPRILAHRWIYLNEAEAMDQLVELLRPLISGGKAVHLTVNKDSGGRNAAQELRIEGPVTTTIPTIRNKLDAQLQSRMLLAELEDYEGRVASHTRKFNESLRLDFATEDHSARIGAWQAALGSLTGIRRVVFALDHEDFCFDRDDVPHGARLWANLIGMMFTHAWLEQRNREIVELPNGEKAVVATPTDFAAAYGVFQATCERSVMNLSDSHRRILDAVYRLQQDDRSTGYFFDNNDKSSWSQREIARRTGVPQSTISAQRSFLVKSLKLLVEEYDGKLRLAEDADPSWWRKEGVLDGLPKPKRVWAWWKAEHDPPGPGSPDRPDHPPQDPADHPGGGANGDRDSSGHAPEAPGQPAEEPEHQSDRGDDPGDPRDPDQENALDKRENGQEEAPTGVTGGFESRDGGSREDNEPENHIRDTDHKGESSTTSKAPTHAEWKAQSAKENLDLLGWARARTFGSRGPADPVDSAESRQVPEDDPVASMLGRRLWISDGWAETATRMLRYKPKDKSEEELRSMGWPVDSQQMHERLEELAPVLQRENPDRKNHPVRRDRFIHAEYWEKESAAEGLWVFVAAREGGPSEEEVEEMVWGEVKYLEGIAPPNPFRKED
jgi:hypothetical protein